MDFITDTARAIDQMILDIEQHHTSDSVLLTKYNITPQQLKGIKWVIANRETIEAGGDQ